MADVETAPQPPPPEGGAEITVDDGDEEETKVHSNLSIVSGSKTE